MGHALPDDRPFVESKLDASDPDVRLAGRYSARRLYHQRHRVVEHEFAENHQVPQFIPSEYAAFKLLYLALQNAAKKWTMPIPNWSQAMNQFAILYDGRLPMMGETHLHNFPDTLV